MFFTRSKIPASLFFLLSLLVSQARAGSPPTADSVTPIYPSTFTYVTAVYSDPDGFADLSDVHMLFNSALSGVNACWIYYVRATNQIFLYNDTATGPVPGFITPGGPSPQPTLSNHQCQVLTDTRGTLPNGGAVTASGNSLSIPISVWIYAISQPENVYGYANDNEGAGSGWQSLYSFTSGGDSWPSFRSITPANGGSDLPVTFTATYDDGNGYWDIHDVSLVFEKVPVSVKEANSCWINYVAASNQLLLLRDDGTGPVSGFITPGVPGTLSNSQCTIANAGPVTNSSQIALSLPVTITFAPSYTGTMSILGRAYDNEGATGGWGFFANWTPGLHTPPTADSVSPANGTGAQQTFTAVYSDAPYGYTGLNYVTLSFVGSAFPNSCVIYYYRTSNQINLLQDSGSGFVPGSITPGGAGSLSNSQCTIASGGLVTASGNSLSFPVNVTSAPTFAGTKTIYGGAGDNHGINFLFTNLGTWNAAANQPPVVNSVTPAVSSGSPKTFTATYSDPNGFTDLSNVHLLFNYSLSGSNACWIYYLRANNQIYLYKDDLSGTVPGFITPGGAGTLSNSQCTVSSGGFVTFSGNGFSLPVTVASSATFLGTKNIYAYANDNQASGSGWQNMGTWSSVVNNSPTADSVSPNSASGQSQTFTFSYSSVGGYANLSSVYALLNGSLASSGGCFVYYASASSALYLANDAGNAWTGPVTPGGAGALQNSQCTINAAAISIEPAGNTLKLTFTATASAAFSGVKNVYGYATDNASLNSGWQSLGAWNSTLGANPLANSVAPSAATGNSQAFTFNFSSPGGFASISYAYSLINASLSTSNGCFVQYYPGANKLYLVTDNGAAIAGSVTPGVAGTAQNSQCTINGVGSAASGSGNTLTVTVAVTASAPFAGPRNVYGYAGDTAGRNSAWQALGTWQATGP